MTSEDKFWLLFWLLSFTFTLAVSWSVYLFNKNPVGYHQEVVITPTVRTTVIWVPDTPTIATHSPQQYEQQPVE